MVSGRMPSARRQTCIGHAHEDCHLEHLLPDRRHGGRLVDAVSARGVDARRTDTPEGVWSRRGDPVARRRIARGKSGHASGSGSSVDFFISYTEADRAWAEWIAVELEHAGYTTVVQSFDFRPASDFLHHMEHALDTADRMLAVISPSYFASDYCMLEWRAAIVEDPTGTNRYLLPVRVRGGDPPKPYRSRVYTDLVGHIEPTARKKLLAAAEEHRPHPQRRRFPGSDGLSDRPRYPSGPEITNLPARNPHFTGRDTILDDLHQQLHAERRTAIVPTGAIHGLGGIGKTQLALEYAHRYASDYDLIWWINAEQQATAITGLVNLAHRLALTELALDSDVVAALLDELRTRDRWLLIYDNAETPQQLNGLLPAGGGGHVLITSRWSTWGRQTSSPFALETPSRPEAVAFLLSRTRHSHADSAELFGQIADLLGDLPLALEEAAAYLESTAEEPSIYLGLLRDRAEELLATYLPDDDLAVHDQQRVATVWSVSLDQVREKTPAAELLLNLLAYLAPDTARTMITDHPEALGSPLSVMVRDRLKYNPMLAVLAKFSLVTLSSEAIHLHRLVQTVIRARLDPATQKSTIRAAVKLLDVGRPKDVEQRAQWTEQVRIVAGHAQKRDLADRKIARLLDLGTQYLRDRGQYRQAKQLGRQALDISIAAFGQDDRQTAKRHARYGFILRLLGDYEGAHTHLKRAVQIAEARTQLEPNDLAAFLTELGGVYFYRGHIEKARAQHASAIEIILAQSKPDPALLALSYTNLSAPLLRLGQAEEAKFASEEAIRIGDPIYGRNHPEMARWRINLGNARRALGDRVGTRAAFDEAVRIGIAALGEDHPEIAGFRNNLGTALEDLGDYVGAREQYEMAIAIGEMTLPAEHPDLAMWRRNLWGLPGREEMRARERMPDDPGSQRTS